MMTKTRWIFLFATFVISCGSLIVLIVATTTTQWVNGRAESNTTQGTTTASLDAHYGLFAGSQDLHILNVVSHYDLAMTCSFGDNICALSCQRTPEARLDEITKILHGETPSECPISSARSSNGALEGLLSRQQDAPSNEQFISSALWLSTVFFLCITILFAFLCTVQSLTNILSNPVWSIFSVYGLYIWNGLAIASAVVTLILWGSLFATSIRYNIAVRHTLTVTSYLSSDGLAALGFSYWILFGPILLHSVNIGLLLWRKWLIEREPPPVAINVNRNDFTILLY